MMSEGSGIRTFFNLTPDSCLELEKWVCVSYGVEFCRHLNPQRCESSVLVSQAVAEVRAIERNEPMHFDFRAKVRLC